MPSQEFEELMCDAQSDLMDRVPLTDHERAVIEREIGCMIDEWLSPRRHLWNGTRHIAVTTMFAVLTHCFMNIPSPDGGGRG